MCNGHFDVRFSLSFFPMARFASAGMHQAASDNAVTKGGRVRGRGS